MHLFCWSTSPRNEKLALAASPITYLKKKRAVKHSQ
jgi:hypothetical protein